MSIHIDSVVVGLRREEYLSLLYLKLLLKVSDRPELDGRHLKEEGA